MNPRSFWMPILLAVLWLATAATRSVPLPEPLGYVTDHGGAISDDWRARIRSVCQDLERKTGVEMVVVTVGNLGTHGSANEYASALYQKWGIGTAQQDHGVLLFASIAERQATITVGRALITRMPPPTIAAVGRQYLEPAFRRGDFGEGLYRATVALATSLQDVRVDGDKRYRLHGLGVWFTVTLALIALGFLWWISRPDQRHPFRRIRRGEYWGAGLGGFGDFGGFGGGTRGGGLN